MNAKPFTNDFPRADVYELLSPDLLHQLIKGTFKDHLVDWINEYIKIRYGAKANEYLDEIDRRYSLCRHLPVSGLISNFFPTDLQNRACARFLLPEEVPSRPRVQAMDRG